MQGKGVATLDCPVAADSKGWDSQQRNQIRCLFMAMPKPMPDTNMETGRRR
jgi:hypothetical protein